MFCIFIGAGVRYILVNVVWIVSVSLCDFVAHD